MSPSVKPRALSLALLCALTLGACGDDGSAATSGPDPATLVPADALLYAEGLVRPEGERREEIESALAALLGDDDPGQTIVEEIEAGLAEEGTELSYAQDIEPWLGERAGIFFADFEREANGAAILESTDEEEAQAGLKRLADQEGIATEESYGGVSYTVTDEDSAIGIVDGFAVIGSVPGFESVVDAARGDSLADSDEFERVTADAREQGVITAYADPASVLEALVASGEISEQQRAAVAEAAGEHLDAPVVVATGVDGDGLYVEVSAAAAETGVPGESDLIERIPADASIAFGLSDMGERLAMGLAQAIALDPAAAAKLDRLEAETGIDLEVAAESFGDVAGYFRGTSLFGLGGALILETSDEQAANDLLDRLREALSSDPSVTVQPGDDEGEAFSVSPAGVPIEFPFVFRDGLVVAGLGSGSVEQAYAPESSLIDSDAYDAAKEALGDGFSLSALVDAEPLVELLAGIPDVATDPDLQAALPYLERIDLLALGVRESDGRASGRLALALDQGVEE